MPEFRKLFTLGAVALTANFLFLSCETPSEENELDEPVSAIESQSSDEIAPGEEGVDAPNAQDSDATLNGNDAEDPVDSDIKSDDEPGDQPSGEEDDSASTDMGSESTLGEIVSGINPEESHDQYEPPVVADDLSVDPSPSDVDIIGEVPALGSDEYQSPEIPSTLVGETEALATIPYNGENSSDALPSSQEYSGSSYVVKSGDSLGTISSKLYGTKNHWKKLAALNGITNPKSLSIGQVLKTNIDQSPQTEKTYATKASPSADEGVSSVESASAASGNNVESTSAIVVAKGDTLSALAQQYLGSASAWRKVWQMNKETIKNPNLIFVGQVVMFPESQDKGYAH